ncbi:MAG: dienelactone hydrolase family protein, partial [Planctomycetota bacterium]
MHVGLAVLLLCSVTLADTVHLKDGTKIHGRVLREEPEVVVNRFNSAFPAMKRGLGRAPRTEVVRIDRSLPAPHREFQRRLLQASTLQACLALAEWCEEQGLKEERVFAFESALRFDSDNESALKGLGRRRPGRDWLADRALARNHLRGNAVKIDKAFPYGNLYLLRARRSMEQPRGYVRERSVALRADRIATGARYALYVPEDNDPLRPTPLVIGLHGGGPGGEDGNLVVGEGWQALGLYLEECQTRRWICACPTAVKGDWSARENSTLLDALLDEIFALYNVDLNRVYLIGHSMGGAGVWAQSLRRPRAWAAVAAASSYEVRGIDRLTRSGTGFYVYHGENDPRTPVADVLRFMEPLAGSGVDFVYTELPGHGHEFPAEVVSDIFRFLEGRLLANRPGSARPSIRPRPSFERKPTRDEERYLDAGSAGATLRSLFQDLRVGGRKAELAASALASHPDPKIPARVAKVL